MTASFCSQVTLCENLREEYLDRMNQNGCSPRLEQLFAKQRKQYEFRNLLQKYGSVLLSSQGDLALMLTAEYITGIVKLNCDSTVTRMPLLSSRFSC